jgi:hypothetical protein
MWCAESKIESLSPTFNHRHHHYHQHRRHLRTGERERINVYVIPRLQVPIGALWLRAPIHQKARRGKKKNNGSEAELHYPISEPRLNA